MDWAVTGNPSAGWFSLCHDEGERCALVCSFGDVGPRCLALLPLAPG